MRHLVAIRDLFVVILSHTVRDRQAGHFALSKPHARNYARKHHGHRRAYTPRTARVTRRCSHSHSRVRCLIVPHTQRWKRVSRPRTRVVRLRRRARYQRAADDLGHHGVAGDGSRDGHQPVEAAGHAGHGDVSGGAGRRRWSEGRDEPEAIGRAREVTGEVASVGPERTGCLDWRGGCRCGGQGVGRGRTRSTHVDAGGGRGRSGGGGRHDAVRRGIWVANVDAEAGVLARDG
jgi:hypothetical protein